MTIGYKILGTGKEHVLIMHDWFSDCASYDYILPFLDTDTFTFAFMDVRGYGLSKEMAGDYSAQEASNDALNLADSLKWDRFHVVGHSMTGMVVQRIAVDAGNRIKSVIAITPTPANGSKAPPETIAHLTNAAESNDDAAVQVAQYLTGNQYLAHYAIAKVKKWRTCSTAKARVGYLRMFSETDFSDEVNGLTTPMLVIHGKNDPRPEEALRETFGVWYPNLEINNLACTGHYPMQEVPVHLVTAMDGFWRKHF